MANNAHIIIHWTHKIRIKKLYSDGYSAIELAQMYKLPVWYIKMLTNHLNQPERI